MKLRRQQLADLLAAYGIEHNPDGTKDELYPLAVAAEQSGRFKRPAKDTYRLNKASKNADEWQMLKFAGVPFPPFEEPEEERESNNSLNMLKARAKAMGINSFGKGKAELTALLAEVEGKPAEG